MNIKSIQLTAIIMLTSLFLLPNFVMGAALLDDPTMWDTANIETVVRLKITDNDPGGTYLLGGYSGLAVMVETRKKGLVVYDYVERDLENHQFPTNVLWYANVVFAPYTNDDWCDLDPTGIGRLYQSQVSLKYVKHPDYGAITRNYNAVADERGGIRDGNKDGDKLKVSSFQEPINAGVDDKVISHQKWLRQSFFEWTLQEPLTITALIAHINQRKIVSDSPLEKRCFPKYSRAGYTDRIWGDVYNCISFSVELLRSFGCLPEFAGTRYDIYNDYKRVVLDHDVNLVVEEPTWKRRMKTSGKFLLVGGCVGICTLGGAALGSYFFPGPGTVAGGEKGAEAGVAAATGIITYFSGSAVATVGGGVLGLAIGGGGSFETVRLVSNVIDAHHTVKSLFHFDEFGARRFKVVRTNVANIIYNPLLPRLLEEPTKGDILSEDREVARRITYKLSGNNVR